MSISDRAKATFCREAISAYDSLQIYLLPQHMGLFYVPPTFRGVTMARVRVCSAVVSDEAFACTLSEGARQIQVAIPWIAAYFMQCETSGDHCIDWHLLGEVNGRAETRAARTEYERLLPDARWYDDVSTGPQIDFAMTATAPRLAAVAGIESGDSGRDAIKRAQARWGYAQSHKGGAQ